jgi:hypothetical protein
MNKKDTVLGGSAGMPHSEALAETVCEETFDFSRALTLCNTTTFRNRLSIA